MPPRQMAKVVTPFGDVHGRRARTVDKLRTARRQWGDELAAAVAAASVAESAAAKAAAQRKAAAVRQAAARARRAAATGRHAGVNGRPRTSTSPRPPRPPKGTRPRGRPPLGRPHVHALYPLSAPAWHAEAMSETNGRYDRVEADFAHAWAFVTAILGERSRSPSEDGPDASACRKSVAALLCTASWFGAAVFELVGVPQVRASYQCAPSTSDQCAPSPPSRIAMSGKHTYMCVTLGMHKMQKRRQATLHRMALQTERAAAGAAAVRQWLPQAQHRIAAGAALAGVVQGALTHIDEWQLQEVERAVRACPQDAPRGALYDALPADADVATGFAAQRN